MRARGAATGPVANIGACAGVPIIVVTANVSDRAIVFNIGISSRQGVGSKSLIPWLIGEQVRVFYGRPH